MAPLFAENEAFVLHVGHVDDRGVSRVRAAAYKVRFEFVPYAIQHGETSADQVLARIDALSRGRLAASAMPAAAVEETLTAASGAPMEGPGESWGSAWPQDRLWASFPPFETERGGRATRSSWPATVDAPVIAA